MSATPAQSPQALVGSSVQFDSRLPARRWYNLHVVPADATAFAGTERLERRLFGGEARGEALGRMRGALTVSDLRRREDASEEAVAEPRDRLLDARDLHDVYADADDHARLSPQHA